MRILVTTFTFPPQASGVSVIAQAQACGLAARGHEVTVATDFDPRRTQEHSFGSLKVAQFKCAGSFDPRHPYHGEILEYQDFVAAGGFDIILCNCWQNWATDLASAVFPRTPARKVVVTQGLDAHMWQRHGRFPWGLGAWMRCLPYAGRLPRQMRAFDQVVFLSQRRDFGRFFDHWLARRWGLKNISIIPNGIHFEELRQAPTDFRQTHGIQTPHLLLNVANYCERKNQLATVQAFARAGRKDTTLVLIGSELNDYAARVQRWHRDHAHAAGPVLFLEKIPKPVINAAYRAADAFILTARAETQPLVILDAMAVGAPFISTDTGCVSEFAGGVIVKNLPAAAAAINRIYDDPAFARRLGAAGQAAVGSTYSWTSVVQELESLFVRLLEQK